MPFGLSNKLVERLRSQIDRELGSKIVRRLTDTFSDGAAPEEPKIDPRLRGPVSGMSQIMYRIRYAGHTKTLLWMKYNNTWRHVEPYEFLRPGRKNTTGTLNLAGWCVLHDEIHTFSLGRVQDLHTTDRPFAPRFPIKVV